jgi:hypothetical protein
MIAVIFLIEFIIIFLFILFTENKYAPHIRKLVRALFLALIITVVNYYGYRFGNLGLFLAWILNLIAVKFILRYNLLKSFLFIIGLGVINYLLSILIKFF